MRTLVLTALVLLFFLSHSCQSDFSATTAFDRGHEVYLSHCVSCHALDGLGNNGSYPPLATRTINTNASLRAFSLITKGSVLMKPIQLDDEEIIDVLNYIQNAWGQHNDLITPEQLRQWTSLE